jgi:DNA-binding transcriptional LysR family regulator
MLSLDSVEVFTLAATLGSFSAAARKLGKSQSTISTAVANLEVDLGVQLFDRSQRKPVLTPHGQLLMGQGESLLAAHSRLAQTAYSLSQGLEPRLSVVLSDTYHSGRFEAAMEEFSQRYPQLELECLIAECEDALALVQNGRAQMGFVETQGCYAPDLNSATVAERSDMALFVCRSHPLAVLSRVGKEQLAEHRELRLATVVDSSSRLAAGRMWSAPSYLMLLEMAQRGFGWAPLPRWLVERFAGDTLVELTVRGWPKPIFVDAIWSRSSSLGPAGSWLLSRMLA